MIQRCRMIQNDEDVVDIMSFPVDQIHSNHPGPLGTSAKMRATSVLPWDLTAPFSLSIKAWKAGVAPGERLKLTWDRREMFGKS